MANDREYLKNKKTGETLLMDNVLSKAGKSEEITMKLGYNLMAGIIGTKSFLKFEKDIKKIAKKVEKVMKCGTKKSTGKKPFKK